MIQPHCSTPKQRAYWVSELIIHEGSYGVVGQMSRDHGVSRQTLYTWKAKGQAALQSAFAPKEQPTEAERELERAVLTLLVEAHTSYRGIKTCLESLLGIQVSLGTIVSIVQVAGQRAQEWLSKQKPSSACAVALDEQYSSKRGEAYLNVVDVNSSLVWASLPPVAVDGESWKLVLWYLQEQGVGWKTAVSDGGLAIQEALHSIEAESKHQRDVWHLLYLGSQIQGRVDRYQANLQAQLPTVRRQAERIAQGKKARGAHPRTDVQAHLAQLQLAEYTASGLRYLLNELGRLLEVVVLEGASQHGILESQHRQSAVETVVQLLVQLEQDAPPALAHEIHTLQNHLRLALPSLLLFARELDHLQQQVSAALGADALYLIGWAWQRRQILGPSSEELVKGFPSSWHPLAKPRLQAWDRAVRASSAVENWHSILRPHLAVHRTLSAEMLALLAVWHNHRVAPRGLHEGQSPLQRSGLAKEATDWLVALGYSPASPPSTIRRPVPVTLKEEGLAA